MPTLDMGYRKPPNNKKSTLTQAVDDIKKMQVTIDHLIKRIATLEKRVNCYEELIEELDSGSFS